MAATVSIQSAFLHVDRESAATTTRRLSLMLNSALFAGVNREECSHIALSATKRVVLRNENLFLQGHPIRSVSLIEKGIVKLSRFAPNGTEGVLWVHGEGDALGVTPSPFESRHSCTARVIETCTVLSWEYGPFQQLMMEYPQIDLNIHAIVQSRLKDLEERYCEIAMENVNRRLACTVRRLIDAIGRESADGIHVGLSRMDMAKMAGMSKFTISRIITEWSNLGLVIPLREALVVRSPRRLEGMCRQEDGPES
jgi:CRP-like cAMP-binding protein